MTTRDITFLNKKGHELQGVLRYLIPEGETKRLPAVIVLAGFGDTKDHDLIATFSNALPTYGFATLRFDYGGHGASGGAFEEHTLLGQQEDVRAAIDFIAQLTYIDQDKIYLLGHDIGGTIAILLAANTSKKEVHPAGIILQGARSHIEKHLASHFQPHDLKEFRNAGKFEHHRFTLNRSYIDSAQEIDVLDAAHRLTVPVLILAGDVDQRVPLSEARELYVSAGGEKALEIIDDGDHWLRDDVVRETVIETIVAWLRRH